MTEPKFTQVQTDTWINVHAIVGVQFRPEGREIIALFTYDGGGKFVAPEFHKTFCRDMGAQMPWE